MPHQFMAIDCKKCGEGYCPVCRDQCPKYGEVDIVDEQTMKIRRQMKKRSIKDAKAGL